MNAVFSCIARRVGPFVGRLQSGPTLKWGPSLGQCIRCQHGRSQTSNARRKNQSVMLYGTACVCLVGAMSYAAVPLYRIYCQATGRGGQAVADDSGIKIESMQKVSNRLFTVYFNADTVAALRWNFKPQQGHITVHPGETALAFYTATNSTDSPIVGIATYNVVPFEVGKYFNKIQCFCFEEQRLNPHEQVDMPVFFYLDPEITKDPLLEDLTDVVLSYTFFEAKEGLQLPVPTIR